MLKKITWDKKTDEVIGTLHPIIRAKARFFVNYLEDDGIFMRIYSGFRSIEEQNQLYAQGRTKGGKIVTNARGGESYHNYGLAFDCVQIIDKKAIWENEKWEYIAKVGEFFGFEWGGKFTSPDKPHFQYTLGLSIKKMLDLYKLPKKEGYINLDKYL
jgi:peptidoglycan L-alanyl-D-glutamate endopeptidase CwlK